MDEVIQKLIFFYSFFIVIFPNSLDWFGFLFDSSDIGCSYWNFTCTIPHNKVYDNGYNELGYLLYDCNGVPMIKVGNEHEKLPNFLDTSPELRNIYFEVLE